MSPALSVPVVGYLISAVLWPGRGKPFLKIIRLDREMASATGGAAKINKRNNFFVVESHFLIHPPLATRC